METKNQKRPTNGQLQKRLERAVLHLDRTKDTQSIYWSDKGCRLTADNDYAIIAFGYSQTVFNNYNMSGVSRPWLYVKRVIEIALENEENIKTENGYSFQKLLDVLKEKEDKSQYNIVTYFSWYLMCLYSPQFSIGETEIESFLVYEDYIHNIARNAILLSEKTDDMTNKQFIQKVVDNLKEFTDDLEENVLFHKKTDEQMMQENIEAIQEQENEQAVEAQADAN
jgi:hypothetical protein